MRDFENCRDSMSLLRAGAAYLEEQGVPEARAEADYLLAHILNLSREKLYLDRERILSAETVRQFWQLAKRRGEREPLAYILKTREFMGLNFYVDSNVLIPRPETELLVEKVIEVARAEYHGQSLQILDLCTGSGAVAVSVKVYFSPAVVTATDISEQALAVARQNAKQNKVQVDFRQGDLFEPVKGRKFDLIVSNPPYVSKEEYLHCAPEVKKEPVLALLGGEDGLEFYRRLAVESSGYLNPGGMIITEIGNRQGSQVAGLFAAQGFNTVILPDYAGWDRIVMADKE